MEEIVIHEEDVILEWLGLVYLLEGAFLVVTEILTSFDMSFKVVVDNGWCDVLNIIE